MVHQPEQEKDELIEYSLVCACSRTDLTDYWCRRIRQLTKQNVQWPLVRRLGHTHGVLPLVYNGLSTCKLTLPARWQDEIERHARVTRIHNAFLVQELGRLVDKFATHGIRTLALKGPVLAQVAYADISLRRYVDLDILIPEDQFSAAEKLLFEIGYEGEQHKQKIQGWRKRLHLKLNGQWPFEHKNGPFVIDLHTRVVPLGYPFPVDFKSLWNRSRRVQVADVEVRGFAPEDMVVILCFHGIKNQWRALKHVVDIAELIRSQSDLGWQEVIGRARVMCAERVLKIGLQLVHDVVRVSLPPEVVKWMEDEPVDDLATIVKGYLRKRHQRSELTYSERVRLQLATKDTAAGKLRYGGYSLMQHLWTSILRP